MDRKRQRKKSSTVSASALAQMGVCERLVVFEHRYGKRSNASQRVAIRRGLKEHERFYREGAETSERRGRCYIAMLTLGPGPETAALRMFRDQVLRPTAMGRRLIWWYYRTAPAICVGLQRFPWLKPIVRAVLRPFAWIVDRTLSRNGGNDGVG